MTSNMLQTCAYPPLMRIAQPPENMFHLMQCRTHTLSTIYEGANVDIFHGNNIHFSESSMRVSPFPSFLSIAKALLSVIG